MQNASHKIRANTTKLIGYGAYLTRPEYIASVVIGVTAVAVAFNTSGVILENYKLQRQVRVAEQKVALADAEKRTQELKNQYFKTDAYLDIAARRELGKALPGEKLIIVPKNIARRNVPQSAVAEAKQEAFVAPNKSNAQLWLDFLTGKLEL